VGQDDFSHCQVRTLDRGGLIWESGQRFAIGAQALAE